MNKLKENCITLKRRTNQNQIIFIYIYTEYSIVQIFKSKTKYQFTVIQIYKTNDKSCTQNKIISKFHLLLMLQNFNTLKKKYNIKNTILEDIKFINIQLFQDPLYNLVDFFN